MAAGSGNEKQVTSNLSTEIEEFLLTSILNESGAKIQHPPALNSIIEEEVANSNEISIARNLNKDKDEKQERKTTTAAESSRINIEVCQHHLHFFLMPWMAHSSI